MSRCVSIVPFSSHPRAYKQRWNPNRNTPRIRGSGGIYVTQCDVWLSIPAWSLIFHPCISVPHFPVLHFQSPPDGHLAIAYSALSMYYMLSRAKNEVRERSQVCAGRVQKLSEDNHVLCSVEVRDTIGHLYRQ